jgi:HAMP domain-containing protein/HPt (histidine-containing phosphotransfer) domain-containing protein
MNPTQSLREKFIATMLLLTGLIGGATLVAVTVLGAQSSSRQLATVKLHIEQGIRAKAQVLTENNALALRPMVLDNAFLDMQRLVARAVKEDTDLVYGIYVTSEKAAVAFCRRGTDCNPDHPIDKEIWRQLGIDEATLVVKELSIQPVSRLNEDLLEVAMPVRGDDEEILGTVRYALSMRRVQYALEKAHHDADLQLTRSREIIGGLVGLAVLLAWILSGIQATRITRPISELTAAARKLAAGNRSVRVAIESQDELQVLGAAFNRMVEELAISYRQLEEMNRTLEQKVQARTAELAAKNRDMRLVLDNVDQGFVTLAADGSMAIERSRVVDDWFGTGDQVMPFWDFVSQRCPSFASDFRLAWDQVLEGFLPLELTLDQLPAELTLDPRTFSFRYIPLFKDETFDGVLLVIADITERIAKEREEAELNELMQGFKRMILDRNGFTSFHREASAMIETICSKPPPELIQLKRNLHTLKGNAAAMGLCVVARLCHLLEDQLAESGVMAPETIDRLDSRWKSLTEHIAAFAGLDRQRMIEIPQAEFAELLSQLSADPATSAICNQLLAWQLEPVERSFERLAEQGRALAKRRGKGELTVAIEGNGVRLDPEIWAPFFSCLVHVIRNAIDHGIETVAERAQSKKPAAGGLFFRAVATPNSMTFEIGDDGRGIDWDAVAENAKERGLPCDSKADLLNALLQDGFTTKKDVTETSGRGVGLSALLQRIETLDGSIDVRSAPGKGTTWVIRFPWPPKLIPAVRSRRGTSPANITSHDARPGHRQSVRVIPSEPTSQDQPVRSNPSAPSGQDQSATTLPSPNR